MKRILFPLFFIWVGCVSHYKIERHHTTFLRRMPQINRIEPGRPMAQGIFTGALFVSYSLEEPEVMQVTDSSFESHSSFFGDKVSIVTSSNGYCYESRIMLSGEGSYAFTDVMSAGVSLDASVGKIEAPLPIQHSTVRNKNIEGSLFIKFAKQFGRLGVAIKPEVSAIHLYGDRVWNEIDAGDTTTATEKLSYNTFSIRSSSIIRIKIIKDLSPFLGFQIKSQPFPKANDDIGHEVCFGLYFGIDYRYRCMALSPFIAFPLGSSASDYRSPVSAGLHMALILEPRNDT